MAFSGEVIISNSISREEVSARLDATDTIVSNMNPSHSHPSSWCLKALSQVIPAKTEAFQFTHTWKTPVWLSLSLYKEQQLIDGENIGLEATNNVTEEEED